MPYFPFFANIENTPCLVVGGGQVALRKIEKLLDFSPLITVVALKACDEIRELFQSEKIELEERAFEDSDIGGKAFVITATGDSGVNRHISQLCKQRHIPCNAVDDPDSCTFFFPALVTEGDVCIGISTGGKSPTLASHLRKSIQSQTEGRLGDICEVMGKVRDYALENIPTEQARKKAMAGVLKKCLESSQLPTEEQLIEMIKEQK